MLGEGCGREEADTYLSHDAQPVSLVRQAAPPLRGGEGALLGRQGLASEEAGHRLRELRDSKRRRLPKGALPALLSVSSARCSVLSSSWIHLKESTTRQLPLSAQEPVWTAKLGWHSVSR